MTGNGNRTLPMIEIFRADITTLNVDAIVNAASREFRGGGGVDGAIHRAAGPDLLQECMRHPELPTGDAILTGGYRLRARYVIHTAGPIWRGGTEHEGELLRRAYGSVFAVARAHADIRSIAFPAISTGVYGFPKHEAASIAVAAMREHEPHFKRIIACLFSEADARLYEDVLGEGRNPRDP